MHYIEGMASCSLNTNFQTMDRAITNANNMVTDGAWQTITPGGTWSNVGGGYGNAQYYRSENGTGDRVTLAGVLAGGTPGGMEVIFTLPEGSRPAKKQIHKVTADGSLDLHINSDGTVVAFNSNTYLSLDGVSFRIG